MSTVLYRTYRPKSFEEMVGQDAIVSVLKKTLKENTIAHAYLFSGSRGTGKTSAARIFATELGTTQNDLYEIDAASNRGIDDIRELRESVRTLPFDSKYKVYIIDEVHMLTKEAFNALLKTLEEPPAHVIFILATTDLEKVPETIISRCQTFVFKKPTETILKNVVIEIAKKENFALENSAAELIALLGDGSFRDTLGVLQKVISFASKKNIDRTLVEEITGAPSSTLVNTFIESLLSENIEKGIESLQKASEQNIDIKLFLKIVLEKMRFLLLLRFAPNIKKEQHNALSETEKAFFESILKAKSPKLSSKTLSRLLIASQETRYASIPELPLELALIDTNS